MHIFWRITMVIRAGVVPQLHGKWVILLILVQSNNKRHIINNNIQEEIHTAKIRRWWFNQRLRTKILESLTISAQSSSTNKRYVNGSKGMPQWNRERACYGSTPRDRRAGALFYAENEGSRRCTMNSATQWKDMSEHGKVASYKYIVMKAVMTSCWVQRPRSGEQIIAQPGLQDQPDHWNNARLWSLKECASAVLS